MLDFPLLKPKIQMNVGVCVILSVSAHRGLSIIMKVLSYSVVSSVHKTRPIIRPQTLD